MHLFLLLDIIELIAGPFTKMQRQLSFVINVGWWNEDPVCGAWIESTHNAEV